MRAKAQNNTKSVLAYFVVPENTKPRFPKREPETQKTPQPVEITTFSGTLEGIRTPDLPLRRRLLYPAELRGHMRAARLHSPVILPQFCSGVNAGSGALRPFA